MISQLVNEPGIISDSDFNTDLYPEALDQMLLYKNILRLLPLFCNCIYLLEINAKISTNTNWIIFGMNCIWLRNDTMERIPFQLSGDIGQVVNSINRLMVTLNALEEERAIESQKDELITNVSHDIRTPLTSILGYLRSDCESVNWYGGCEALCRNRTIKPSKWGNCRWFVWIRQSRRMGLHYDWTIFRLRIFLNRSGLWIRSPKTSYGRQVSSKPWRGAGWNQKMVRVINNQHRAVNLIRKTNILMEVLKRNRTIMIRNEGDPISKRGIGSTL